jgi:hypothetical protein
MDLRSVRIGLAGIALLVGVAGCASPPSEPGHWVALGVDRVRLAPVTLANAEQLADPRVCRFARADLEKLLVQALPRRLAPVAFRGPGQSVPTSGRTATLRVVIGDCRIESHQWDVGGGEPDITFYETLALRVRLTGPDGRTLLDRRLETVEQVQTDIPTPLFDFPHTVPAARLYGLFSRGRYWQAD